jgi:predicted Holliday junction resolvase-like endonuclease
MTLLYTLLSFFTSRLGQIVGVSVISMILGLYVGNSWTITYYKAKEIAALNNQIKRNKKVIEAQTKYVSEIRDRELKLEEELETALEEARNSPTANNISLPADSVQRLNKIR